MEGKMTPYVTVRSVLGERFTQEIESGKHQLFSDRQVSLGGSDQGPGPYGYLLAALGSWISITLRMYAERKKLALQSVEIELKHEWVQKDEKNDDETEKIRLDRIQSRIRLKGNLSEAERKRLIEIANRCPVHKTLSSSIEVQSYLIWFDVVHFDWTQNR
jgi:putative redox protein